MKITEIYKKYQVPINLQEHMLRVASVANFIVENWIDDSLDKNKVLAVSLLHDIGNIVKFDFEKNTDFYSKNEVSIDQLKKIQLEFINKYGNDDDEANVKILSELGLDKELIDIVRNKKFSNCINTSLSENWILKILLYSDLRVLPHGIDDLENRFKDVMDRMPKYSNRPDIQDMFSACRNIELEIQKNVAIPLSVINSLKINEDLVNFELKL